MAYTSHGHQVAGTPVETPRPDRVARCGGPGLCKVCSPEAEKARFEFDLAHEPGFLPSEHPSLGNVGDLAMQRKVLEVVRAYLQKQHDSELDDQLVIVWFSKTLQHAKALVGFDPANGRYFEVTCNGDKNEAYVDEYRKIFNVMIPLGG
ncbi:DUF6275 family protein [uncultured Gordonia sp.]|mgnify:CR=1 FL=1|uniref:DUF6275 family protein n=1 Tax=uncultured Gordonia sp. TaxID=198437 RepID=UPI00262C56E4|nr:DUF6275 family protein [uncultured Gordonia sp.]